MDHKVKIVPATMEHVTAMAPHVREADRLEIWALLHMNPEQALAFSIQSDGEHYATLLDDKVVAIFGVVPDGACSAVLWLVGTDDIPKNAELFHKYTAEWLKAFRKRFDRIYNWVDARNTVAVRWIESVGFTLYPAVPLGIDQMPFHFFEWKRTS